MRTRGCPVLVVAEGRRVPTGLKAPATEQPAVVALQLREQGWEPFRVVFDSDSGTWIASVFERRQQKLPRRVSA